LQDSDGNLLQVTAWAPLEVPPPIPGREGVQQPFTMRHYLGRMVSVTGKYTPLDSGENRHILIASASEIAASQPISELNVIENKTGPPTAANTGNDSTNRQGSVGPHPPPNAPGVIETLPTGPPLIATTPRRIKPTKPVPRSGQKLPSCEKEGA
jgi:hypothetical protein